MFPPASFGSKWGHFTNPVSIIVCIYVAERVTYCFLEARVDTHRRFLEVVIRLTAEFNIFVTDYHYASYPDESFYWITQYQLRKGRC